MSKVILKGYILVPDSDVAAVKDELLNHMELTRQEVGCLVFEVIQDKKDINRFNVYEEFTDQKAFDFHQNRARRSRWGKVSENAERHYHIETVD